MRVALFWILTLSGVAAAAQPSLDQAAWLAGHWQTQFQDGTLAEELWIAPAGGVMAGLYRQTGPDGFDVAELLLLADAVGGPILRFKHFRSDYSTWEGNGPPVVLRLTQAGPDRLVFDAEDGGPVKRIVYGRRGADALEVDVVLADGRFSLLFKRKP